MASGDRKLQSGAQMLSKSPLPGESAVAKSVREQKFPLSLLRQGLQVGAASIVEAHGQFAGYSCVMLRCICIMSVEKYYMTYCRYF